MTFLAAVFFTAFFLAGFFFIGSPLAAGPTESAQVWAG
jgi:hypothetical protein